MRLLYLTATLIKKRPELAILVALGFFLRIQGSTPGYFAHGDELMYGEAVYMILNKTLGMEVQILGYYPPLIAWIMLIIFVIFFIPLTAISRFPELLIDKLIFGKNWINALYWGRYITVAFSCGVIVLTYLLTIKIFNSRLTATLAAFFVAINYRLILNSKIGFLDIYNVFFLLVALLAVVNLYQKPTFKKYIATWIAIGLSFLVKYQFYAIPGFALVHLLISVRKPKNIFNKGFVLGGLLVFVTTIASHYYHFQHWERVRGMFEYQALKYGMGVNNFNIFPISYIYHTMLGPVFAFMGVAGIIISLRHNKYRVATLVLTSALGVIFFIYLYYSTGGTYTRNLLVVLPILLIFAAYFFNFIWETKKAYLSAFLIAAVTFASGQQLANAVTANQILTNPSDRVVMEKWIGENISPGSKIGHYQGSFTPSESDFLLKPIASITEAISFRELVSEGVEYMIVDFSMNIGSFVWWMGQPTDIALKFWRRPVDLLSQNYVALATRELLWNHTIQAYLPKWQVYGYNYAILQLGNMRPRSDYDLIKQYSFKDTDDDWVKLNFFEEAQSLLTRGEMGYMDSGSLLILEEDIKAAKIKRVYSKPGMVRWESPTFNVKGSRAYRIEAWVRANVDIEKSSRNGFIRIDFYDKYQKQTLTSRPKISFVSERYWGTGWKRLEIEAIAPDGIKFARLGFQTDQAQSSFSVDNISIFESTSTIDTNNNKHIIIDDEDLFPPNDGGFL